MLVLSYQTARLNVGYINLSNQYNIAVFAGNTSSYCVISDQSIPLARPYIFTIKV